jgi:phosphoserine phosphatase
LQQANWHIAIASGGFTYFTDRLQQALALDAALANQLTVAAGQLTGSLHGPLIDAAAKAAFLQQLTADYGLERGQTVAVGDGANDLAMLAVAGLGIALHAKPVVRALAAATVDHHDLDGVIALLAAEACRTQRWDRR